MSAPKNEEEKGRKESPEKTSINIGIDPTPKGEWKVLGSGDRDQWNERLLSLTVRALPVNLKNVKAVSDAGSAVMAGVVDMKPADPIEGALISQIVVANEAAMNLYRLGWANAAEYFEAGTKYLQLADKASRTVAMLTERLDQHRIPFEKGVARRKCPWREHRLGRLGWKNLRYPRCGRVRRDKNYSTK
jgi:hypothetical protein